MPERPAHHGGRVSKEAAKQIDVVNAVVKNFNAGMLLEKWEELPGSIDCHANFRVVELTEMPLFHEPASGHHKWRKAKLEVDRREKALAATAGENALGHGKVFAHGLLQEYRRTLGKQIEDLKKRCGGYSDIVNRIRRGSSDHLRGILIDPGNAELGSKLFGPAAIQIADAGDRKTRQFVRRQVGIADDSTGADNANRARPEGKRRFVGYVHRD
jgi:hypothetical protein